MGVGGFLGRFASLGRGRNDPAPGDDDDWDWEVVGESQYQHNLWMIVGEQWDGDRRVRVAKSATVVPEPDNPYDANAVAVHIGGLVTGYLSRADAKRNRERIVARQAATGHAVDLPALIVGGGQREDGPGMLGVFLRADPSVFGAAVPDGRNQEPMRTGLSAAIATDLEDDSYDLSWLATLPTEPVRAIPALRKLLIDEQDPLDRHFMFSQLEDALYASREAFTSALDEYDECCRQHDLEMEAIRRACMAKWQKVPWLDTYRQMCIRLAKVKRFDDAVRWAERGIAVYGSDAARPEAVMDLTARAASYRAKLAPKPKRERPAQRSVAPRSDEPLICARCGDAFQHARTRGRKPSRCPNCRIART